MCARLPQRAALRGVAAEHAGLFPRLPLSASPAAPAVYRTRRYLHVYILFSVPVLPADGFSFLLGGVYKLSYFLRLGFWLHSCLGVIAENFFWKEKKKKKPKLSEFYTCIILYLRSEEDGFFTGPQIPVYTNKLNVRILLLC